MKWRRVLADALRWSSTRAVLEEARCAWYVFVLELEQRGVPVLDERRFSVVCDWYDYV